MVWEIITKKKGIYLPMKKIRQMVCGYKMRKDVLENLKLTGRIDGERCIRKL